MTRVNWFYCGQCEKDVTTVLFPTIETDDLNQTVSVTVEAICTKCGATLAEKETYGFGLIEKS